MTWPEKGQGETRTFTAKCGDLGERVVAAVALAANDAGLAGALAGVHVTGPAVGAVWEAVTRQAGVLVWGPVVILLQMPEAAHATSDACGDRTPGRCFLSNVKVPAQPWASLCHPPPACPEKARLDRCVRQESTSSLISWQILMMATCIFVPQRTRDSNGHIGMRMALAKKFFWGKIVRN